METLLFLLFYRLCLGVYNIFDDELHWSLKKKFNKYGKLPNIEIVYTL